MAEKDKLAAIMTAFIAIILLVVFSGVIGDNEAANTKISSFVNESVVIVGGSGDLSNVDITSITFFGNATNLSSTQNANIVIGEHVNFTKNGTLQVVQNLNLSAAGDTLTTRLVFADGTYNVSGTYEGSLYVSDPKSRKLLSLTTLFWVILGLAIGYIALRATSDNFNFGFK